MYPCHASICICLHKSQNTLVAKKLFTLLDLCVSSLRRGHANLLCIVPILTDDPRRESSRSHFHKKLRTTHVGMHKQCVRSTGRQKRSAVVHVNPHQRSLPTTQIHYPTIENTARFCLLCCQPEPVPLSLSTRTSQLTPRCPCGVPTWSGQAINAARRT